MYSQLTLCQIQQRERFAGWFTKTHITYRVLSLKVNISPVTENLRVPHVQSLVKPMSHLAEHFSDCLR